MLCRKLYRVGFSNPVKEGLGLRGEEVFVPMGLRWRQLKGLRGCVV